MKHQLAALLLVLSLVPGCQAARSPAPTIAPPEAIPSATIASTAGPKTTSPAQETRTPILEPTLAETPLPTQAGPGNLGAWRLGERFDNRLPEVIVPGETGYRLVEGWEPVRIDYIFEWWGWSTQPKLEVQAIEAREGSYYKGEKEVPADDVKSLLAALQNFHPTQFLVAGQGHTDDYPSWRVELTGPKDERILLLSNSTDNPGAAPWNLVYNGRLYAQVDGAVSAPLGRLFPSQEGETPASFSAGGRDAGTVVFSTTGWPRQLLEGFSGLLPIADGFSMQADPEKGEIRGVIEGQHSIGGFGNMVIGSLTELKQVQLTGENDQAIGCRIEPVQTSDPAGAIWQFTCPVGTARAEFAYRFPIQVQMAGKNGGTIEFSGTLFGAWGLEPDFWLAPPSEEIQAAFNALPAAADLLQDHALGPVTYQEVVTLASGERLLAGEAVLLGQTGIENTALRYTLQTPFVIRNGAFQRWDLDRARLDAFLSEVKALALTRRVLQANPHATVNLWYAEAGQMPDLPYLVNYAPTQFELRGEACGDRSGWQLPGKEEALRAFSFDAAWDFNPIFGTLFVLSEQGPVVQNLSISKATDQAEVNPGQSALIPKPLDAAGAGAFGSIEASALSNDILIELPEGSGDPGVYQEIFGKLPVKAGKADTDGRYHLTNAMAAVREDGTLEVVDCARQQATKGESIAPLTSPDGQWTVKIFPPNSGEKHGSMIVEGVKAKKSWMVRYDPGALDLDEDGVPYPVFWSPDGKSLYYTFRPYINRELFLQSLADGAGLFRMNLANGKSKELVPVGALSSFAISADDRMLASIRNADGPQVLETSGGGKDTSLDLTEYQADEAGGLAWSPDGKQVVFTIHNWEKANYQILLYEPKSKQVRVLVKGDERLLVAQEWTAPGRVLIYDYTIGEGLWLDVASGGLFEGPQITPVP